MKTLPPLLRTRATLTLAALKIRKRDLDHGARKDLARAMVKVPMVEVDARAAQAGPRPFRSAHARGGGKKFPFQSRYVRVLKMVCHRCGTRNSLV